MSTDTIGYGELTEAQAATLKPLNDAAVSVYARPALNSMMRPPCFKFLYRVLEGGPALGGNVDYLEIGSFQGASLIVIGSILRTLGRLGSICSIDPYFIGGYEETPPFETEAVRKRSTPRVMRQALLLYETVGLEIEHIRDVSTNAMVQFLRTERKFDLIFIDGNHEKLNPMIDMALSLQVIRPGGYILMDDIHWPDINPVVELCAKHLTLVAREFNKACFQVAAS